MVVIVVLAKVPVNCSREGVILQMALGVINAIKEPAAICGFPRDGFSCYQRNQGVGCNLRLYPVPGLAWLPRTGTLGKLFHQIVVGNLGEQ